ncbi:SAV_6107 family HEPN domain-containing protein, partial [Nocardia wallacei]|uniref:SAV_6107 family HEPN domain-containing protein n=1 Tax=Nocardia wallacei TaxID=480035 RepID=UPI002458A6A0
MAGRIGYPGRPGRAGGLLDRADGLLLQSAAEGDPRERFRTAYLAALRGAGAVLAITGADRAPRARSRNAWVLMQQAAPEFVMWADYFSSFSETRAGIEAGLDRPGAAPRAAEVASRGGALRHGGEGRGSSA